MLLGTAAARRGGKKLRALLVERITSPPISYYRTALEQYVQNDWYSTLAVPVREPGGASLRAITEVFFRHQLKLKSMELEYDLAAGTRKILGQVKYKKGDLVGLPSRLSAELARLPGVLQIEWR